MKSNGTIIQDLLLLILIAGLANFTTATTYSCSNCSDCESKINSAIAGDTVKLNADIINSSATFCMNIKANDITLDCQNYIIDGRGISYTYGISITRAPAENTNILVKNCKVKDWYAGIYLDRANSNTFANITSSSNLGYGGIYVTSNSNNTFIDITSFNNSDGIGIFISNSNAFIDVNSHSNYWGSVFCSSSDNNTFSNISSSNNKYGFYLFGCDYNVVETSIVFSNTLSGFYLDKASKNRIYNNLINNSENIAFYGVIYGNYWNTTRQTGNRIYSAGAEISGNYWTNPIANGCSDTCIDHDVDGFCDESYTLATDNIDYLPLAMTVTTSTTTTTTTTTTSTTINIGSDIRLTNDPAYSQRPVIATSGNNVHVVWDDNKDSTFGEIYYKRSIDNGVTWGDDIRLSNDPSQSVDPMIAVDGNKIYVVWDDTRDVELTENSEIYYKYSTDNGLTWSSDIRLTYAKYGSWSPAIAVSGNNIHLVFEDERNKQYYGEIYYKKSTDGGVTWRDDVRLTDDLAWSRLPKIAINGDNIHVVWFSDKTGHLEAYYKKSTDGGSTWTSTIKLDYENSTTSSYPDIAVSGNNVHVVWHDYRDGVNEKIYYKRSTDNGVTWNPDTRLSDFGYISSMNPAIALNDNVYVLWDDSRDGHREIYYKMSTNGGVTWGQDTRLSIDDSSYSEYPAIAAIGNNIHVVWKDERDGNDEIYYKHVAIGGSTTTTTTSTTTTTTSTTTTSITSTTTTSTTTTIIYAWGDGDPTWNHIDYTHSSDIAVGDGNVKLEKDNETSPIIIWNRTYDSGVDDAGYAAAVDSDNNILVTGYISNEAMNYDCFTIKYNYNGEHIWNKRYDASDDDTCKGVTIDSKDNVIVAGHSHGASIDGLIVKYDQEGNLVWNKTYDAGVDELFYAVAIDSNDNIMVTGRSESETDVDYLTIQYDSNGNILWKKTYNRTNVDKAFSIAIDPNDNIIVTGRSGRPGTYFIDYLTIKYDSNGNVIWNRSYGGGSDYYAYAVAVDSNGNVIVTGYQPFETNPDYTTIKYNSNGELLWNKSYDSGAKDEAFAIAVDSHDNIIIAGNSKIEWVDYNRLSIKYDSDGNILWNKTYYSDIGYATTSGVVLDSNDDILVTGNVYSNNNNYFTVKYTAPYKQSAILTSAAIIPKNLTNWDKFHVSDNVSGQGTGIKYSIRDNSTGVEICNCTQSQAGFGCDISTCAKNTSVIKLYAELTTINALYTPILHGWNVSWNFGVTPDECLFKGDSQGCDGIVSDFELLDYINKWIQSLVNDFDLLEAIDNWAKG